MLFLDTQYATCRTGRVLGDSCSRETIAAPLIIIGQEDGAERDPAGDAPGYDDNFQQLRKEVNRLSGADTELICQPAKKRLTAKTKNIRVATYYT